MDFRTYAEVFSSNPLQDSGNLYWCLSRVGREPKPLLPNLLSQSSQCRPTMHCFVFGNCSKAFASSNSAEYLGKDAKGVQERVLQGHQNSTDIPNVPISWWHSPELLQWWNNTAFPMKPQSHNATHRSAGKLLVWLNYKYNCWCCTLPSCLPIVQWGAPYDRTMILVLSQDRVLPSRHGVYLWWLSMVSAGGLRIASVAQRVPFPSPAVVNKPQTRHTDSTLKILLPCSTYSMDKNSILISKAIKLTFQIIKFRPQKQEKRLASVIPENWQSSLCPSISGQSW